MFRSLGNVLANPRVGLLFLDFEKPRRLRVLGRARLEEPRGEFEGEQLWCAFRRSRSSPTVRATSTGCRWSRPRSMPRARGTSRPSRPGRRASATCCRKRTERQVDNPAPNTSSLIYSGLEYPPSTANSIARRGDHRALRIWLRLLTCTQLIERRVRSRAARAVRHHAAALRPDGAARAPPRGPEDERALAHADGHRRQHHRDRRPAREGGPGRALDGARRPARVSHPPHAARPARPSPRWRARTRSGWSSCSRA